jgi:hypothetical protein
MRHKTLMGSKRAADSFRQMQTVLPPPPDGQSALASHTGWRR